ncbi:hypothetical protein J45TS6_25440 [Paenibacillus sp. J45TS6]|uniref:hypothetical protein n=1 Tax=Paenibacillus sp. J45TS6 TaxID=2807196 RepID=UPI001B257B36|nr:hypothetical protein [Paenibacillus sp. J45TS6]GIP44085.1 hypothetical protein J45TS6_25440 [Paenibacillus sp. J45TS6]
MENNAGKDLLYLLIFVVISFFAVIIMFPYGLALIIGIVLFFLYKIVSLLIEIRNRLEPKVKQAEETLE